MDWKLEGTGAGKLLPEPIAVCAAVVVVVEAVAMPDIVAAPMSAELMVQVDALLTVGLQGMTPVAASVLVLEEPAALAMPPEPPPQPVKVRARKPARAAVVNAWVFIVIQSTNANPANQKRPAILAGPLRTGRPWRPGEPDIPEIDSMHPSTPPARLESPRRAPMRPKRLRQLRPRRAALGRPLRCRSGTASLGLGFCRSSPGWKTRRGLKTQRCCPLEPPPSTVRPWRCRHRGVATADRWLTMGCCSRSRESNAKRRSRDVHLRKAATPAAADAAPDGRFGSSPGSPEGRNACCSPPCAPRPGHGCCRRPRALHQQLPRRRHARFSRAVLQNRLLGDKSRKPGLKV